MMLNYDFTNEITPAEARELQKSLAGRVIAEGDVNQVRSIVGLDVSVRRDNQALAAAVVLSYPDFKIIEKVQVESVVTFPYIPGLLSFREIPLVLQVWQQLERKPDLLMVDGQGIAHPRHLGLAAHLGLLLDMPTIGCAKSHLFGDYQLPGEQSGSFSFIKDPADKAIIGAVVRSKKGISPLFVSTGHKIGLSSAIEWVLKCCQGYRLPEPTRLAHLASRGDL